MKTTWTCSQDLSESGTPKHPSQNVMTYHKVTLLMLSTYTQIPRSNIAPKNHLSIQFISTSNLYSLEILSETTSSVSKKEIHDQ